jgi:hypothetical protein
MNLMFELALEPIPMPDSVDSQKTLSANWFYMTEGESAGEHPPSPSDSLLR